MTYKSDAEAGTMELDRKWLKGVLEERFGYAVYDCDVLRGKGTYLRCSLITAEPKQWHQ